MNNEALSGGEQKTYPSTWVSAGFAELPFAPGLCPLFSSLVGSSAHLGFCSFLSFTRRSCGFIWGMLWRFEMTSLKRRTKTRLLGNTMLSCFDSCEGLTSPTAVCSFSTFLGFPSQARKPWPKSGLFFHPIWHLSFHSVDSPSQASDSAFFPLKVLM